MRRSDALRPTIASNPDNRRSPAANCAASARPEAEAFAARLAAQYGLPVPALGPETREAIRAHPWPGNVRELRNAIERALVLSPPGTLELGELGRRVVAPVAGLLPFPATLRQITLAAAQAMLDAVSGNKSEAARRLGISRPRLQRILDGQGDDDT